MILRPGWNLSEAARRVDVARSHLHEPIGTFWIERTDSWRPPLASIRVERPHPIGEYRG